MSEQSSGRVQCYRCRTLLLSPYDSTCPRCGSRQYEVKHCRQCYSQMPKSIMDCPYCKHNQCFLPTQKPCMLCLSMIPIAATDCPLCQVTQDVEILRKSSFRVCLNPTCRRVISINSQICYNCKQLNSGSSDVLHGSQITFNVHPSIAKYEPKFLPSNSDSPLNNQGHAQSGFEMSTEFSKSAQSLGAPATNIGEVSKGSTDKQLCVLCKAHIPKNSQFCFTCQVTQDIDALCKQEFRICLNPNCDKLISTSLAMCYGCKWQQESNTAIIHGSQIFNTPSLNDSEYSVVPSTTSGMIPKAEHLKISSSNQTYLPGGETASSYGQVTQEANIDSRKKSCLLCNAMIPMTSEFCFTCQTPQYIEVLKRLQFKICCNTACKKIIRQELKLCYSCRHPQDSNTTLTSGSELNFPIFTSEGKVYGGTNVVQKKQSSNKADPPGGNTTLSYSQSATQKNSGLSTDSGQKSCVLCNALIPVSSQYCSTCQTSQDIEIFLKSPFKHCCNTFCKRIMGVGLEVCYNCKQPQDPNATVLLGSQLTFPISAFMSKTVSPPGSVKSVDATITDSGRVSSDASNKKKNASATLSRNAPKVVSSETIGPEEDGKSDAANSSKLKRSVADTQKNGCNDVRDAKKNTHNASTSDAESTSGHFDEDDQEKKKSEQNVMTKDTDKGREKGNDANVGQNTGKGHATTRKAHGRTPEQSSGNGKQKEEKSKPKTDDNGKSHGEKSMQAGSSSLTGKENAEVSKKSELSPKQFEPKPTGFRDKNDPYAMIVVFKAILPTHCWGIQGTPAVYIRFGDSALGKWEYDFGPGKVERDLNEGFLLIRFFLHLKTSFIKFKKIQYKYLVYSEKVMDQNSAYEFLHEFTEADVNRYLEVPTEKCIPKDYYRQYDTMICPRTAKITSVSKKDQLWKWLTGGKAETKQQDVVLIPHPSVMRQMCMEYYLIPSKELFLIGNFYEKYDIFQATDGIVHLYDCLYRNKAATSRNVYPFSYVDSLKEVMANWLLSVVKELFDQKSIDNSKRLVSAVSILVAHGKLRSQYQSFPTQNKEKIDMIILKMVSLSPTGAEYSYLKLMMKSKQSKSFVQNSLIDVFNCTVDKMRTGRKVEPDIALYLLKLLPIIHFLRDDCIPFQAITFDVSKQSWWDPHLSIKAFHEALMNKSGLMQGVIDEINSYFHLDPLLIPIVVYLCPKDDLPLLCDHVPLYLIIQVINNDLSAKVSLNRSEVESYISKPLLAMMSRFVEKEFKPTNHSAYLATLKTLLSLSLRLLISSSDKDKIGVMNCAFVVLAFAYNTTGDDKDHCHNMVKTFIQNWISKDSVIGGSMFGGSWDWYPKKLKRKDAEMKLWKNILDCTAHKIYEKLPLEIKEEWMNILTLILNSRVANVADKETKVELFCDLEKQRSPHEFFANVFMVHATEALDDIFSSQQSSLIRFFQTAQSIESERITKLFGSLLNKKYPRFRGSLMLNELLDWELWPGFLKIFATHSKFVQDVNQDWQTICVCALTLFESVCAKVISGEISAKELSLIKSKEEQMIRLTTVVTSLNTGNYPTPKALKQSMQKRSEEYKFFDAFKAKLEFLASIISCDAIAVKDLNQLLVLLKRDNTADPINSLCTEENKVYSIRCYPGAEVLFPYIEQFLLIFKTYPTKFFKANWEKKLTKVGSTKNPFTYEDVIETWKMLLDDCKTLLERLKSWKMRLIDIDQELKGFYTNQTEVLHDLQNLNEAVSTCYYEIPDSELVKKISCHISQYWELCEYHEPARALLKIRDSLELEGDFSIVERVASQKFEAEDTLKSIDQSVVVASGFLKAYAADKRRQECLQAFSECQRIVEWIRNLGRRGNDDSESNVNALQNFVNIALATAAGGEGDYNTDKLVNLRVIGSGFGPLIYKLPKTAGYQLLQDHCQDLWKALHDARNLPEIMRACEKEIQWYKSIHETQGSVEKTSFGQMKNINQLGHYEIGSIRSGRLTSRSEAIHVRLREPEDKNKTLPQYKYNLDELRDLESKLVLIAGPESSERKNVDLFLDTFHSVCRIADVLMELQHHGNTEYIRWSLRFSCSMSQVFELLKYQAKKMESDLENWQNQVKYQRDRIYELNYFTTPQLLALREELGTFSDSMEQKPQVKSDVMNLLYGISRCLTPGLIKDALLDKSESLEPPDCLQNNVQEQNKTEDIKTPSSNLEKKANTFRGKSTEKQEIDEIREANFPKPRLTFEDLTLDQKSHLLNLKSCDYHVSLILLGFERCPATTNMLEDVANWCEVHNDDFDYPESEDSDSYIDSESDSDESPNVDESREGLETEETVARENDSIENGEPTKEQISVEVHKTKREDEKKFGRREEGATDFKQVSEFNPLELIETKELIPLDKNHPAVVELLGLGFPLERCLDAVEKFKNDTSQAIDYIISDDKQGTSSVAGDTDGTLEQEAGEEILEKMRIEIPDKTSKSYMSLSDLGQLLHKLAKEHKAPVPQPREIPDPIKSGECNLLVVPSGHVLKTTLSLFMESPELPLPTHEEVLICNEQTTAEETNLLWKRALGDPGYKRIFCLVHAECLLYQVWDKSLSELQQLSQDKKGFKIVIICSNEDEEKSNIISKLQIFRRPYQGIHSDDGFLEYLKSHFIQEKGNCKVIQASSVDKECSSVRIVSSTRAGMGKSLYIRRLKEKLVDSTGNDLCEVIVPVHGPKVNADSLIESLSEHFVLTEATIFHIDISQTVLRMVDSLLFSLLILQTVCDSKGRVWRVNPAHLYVVEVTIPEDEGKQLIAQSTIDFLKIFPTIHCKSPKSVLRMISNEESVLSNYIMMDNQEFRSPFFQRVFQYIRRHNAKLSLDDFTYRVNSVEGDYQDCLQTLLRYVM